MKSGGGKWVATFSTLLAGLGLALYLRGVDFSDPPRLLPRCAFHFVTGLYCPGCGNTRASYALLHGDVPGALRQNALFVMGLPFLLYWTGRSWWGWVYPQRLRPLPWNWRTSYSLILVGVVMTFWIVRNLPYAPFDRLAPTAVMANRGSAAPAGQLPGAPPRAAR